MTNEEIDKLEAGRELDALISATIFGVDCHLRLCVNDPDSGWSEYESLFDDDHDEWYSPENLNKLKTRAEEGKPQQGTKLDYCFLPDGHQTYWEIVRNYSTRIADAFEIIPVLENHPDEILFELVRKGFYPNSLFWACTFRHCSRHQGRYDYFSSKSAPLAICKAALMAVQS